MSSPRSLTAFLCAVTLLAPALAGVAAAQAPTLLVVNKAENTLAVMDPATGKVLSRIPTGDGPHEVALSADGRTAFVGNYGPAQSPGNSLSVIDIAAGKEVRRVDLGGLRRPHGMVVRGTALYFTTEVSRTLARYDTATNSVDWVMGTGEAGTHMVVATADGATLFTSNIGSDSVTAFERGTGAQAWTVTRIPVGKGPEGIDLSPDGKELWAAHSRDGGISVVDVASKKVVATFDIGTKRSNRVHFTRDGRLVLVSDLDAGELVVVDAATRRATRRIPLGKAPSGILLTPDGAQAYVALTGENALVVLDVKTLAPVGRLATGAGPDGMAWRQ
jgi:YVTN family beta-propeller protein